MERNISKSSNYVILCALLGVLIASGVSVSADEKLNPDNTSLGNTTVGGYDDSSDGWDYQPSGHGGWLKAKLKLINLGTLGGDSTSSAKAINDRGEIVGDYTSSNGVTHAFYYQDGLMRSLSSERCNAVAINDSGQIAGNLLTYSTNIFTNIFLPPIAITNNPFHPITNIIVFNPLTNILTQSANFAANTEVIPVPNQNGNEILTTNLQIVTNLVINSQPVFFRPGSSPNLFEGTNNGGFASGINNQGKIVGAVTLFNSITQYAFVYEKGLTTDLPELSSAYDPSAATAINNHGDIVGFSAIGLSSEHPFLYSQGLMQDLGTLGGSIGEATAINDVGEIVGYSTTTSNAEVHAFLYRQGQMIDLGGLLGAQFLTSTNPSGFSFPKLVSYASAINNEGQIVGFATATNGASHAFLYRDGTMIDLNNLVRLTYVNGPPGFLTLEGAGGINDWGQIVGVGSFWDGKHKTARAFLLDSAP
jgi:probable HAF family extracellular repeat protein